MNRFLKSLSLILLIGAGLVTSCRPKEDASILSLELPSGMLAFTQAGGTQEVAVVASDDEWTIDKSEKIDWLTVERVKNILKVTTSENTTGKERTTSIALTTKGLRKEIKVSQDGRIKSIVVDKEEHTFGSEGGEVRIAVEANSEEWSYTLSEEASWLSVERGNDNKSLIVTAKPSFDPNPRELYLAVTNGESATIHLRQVGIRLFPDFKLTTNMTRAEVEAYAKEAGLRADTELVESGHYEGDKWVKEMTTRKEATFSKDDFYLSDALLGKYIVYQYSDIDKDMVYSVQILCEAGKEYQASDVAGYLSGMGYIHAGFDERGRDHWIKNDIKSLKSYKVEVYLKYDINYSLGRPYPKAGRLAFLPPTDINPSDVGNILTEFPAERLETFRDPSIQFEQVEAYEKSRGFRLMTEPSGDPNFPYCKKSTTKGYEHLYEYVQFMIVDIDGAKEGDLISTQYMFLIPGMNNYLKDYNVTATKENAGAIGQRVDIYKGYKKFFTRNAYGWWSLKADVVEYAKRKGYELATTDRKEYGWTYFTKGDDVIFMAPGEDNVAISFFRNAKTAETARNNKRDEN